MLQLNYYSPALDIKESAFDTSSRILGNPNSSCIVTILQEKKVKVKKLLWKNIVPRIEIHRLCKTLKNKIINKLLQEINAHGKLRYSKSIRNQRDLNKRRFKEKITSQKET